MSIFTVDVFSGSADSIVTDSHAQGVIIKATQGTGYVNPQCNHQWDLAGANGKLRGLYHYAGGGDPVSEAQYFIKNISNYVHKGILAIDWEENQNSAWGNTNWVRQFVDEVHRLTGVWCVIYVQESALNQVANCANDCGVWVAKYALMTWNSWTLPNISVSSGAFSALTGWQFTGGDMDRSIFYLDANGWNRLANPNGSSSNPDSPGSSSNPDNPGNPSKPDSPDNPAPTPQEEMYRQIVEEYGYDSETGIYGKGYSNDNGKTFVVQDTAYGRKYRQQDADTLWKYLQGFVSKQIASAVSLTWDNIKGKPDVALKSDLPVVPTDLVHTAELEKVKSDVTLAKQDAAQAVANAESAKATIDTRNIHQIKKPSDYSEGFSYELKEVSELIPDRSNLDSTAQDGSQGIITTEACKGYARQTLKVIDSQRPLTFIRNGSGDSWYPFELVTTW